MADNCGGLVQPAIGENLENVCLQTGYKWLFTTQWSPRSLANPLPCSLAHFEKRWLPDAPMPINVTQCEQFKECVGLFSVKFAI